MNRNSFMRYMAVPTVLLALFACTVNTPSEAGGRRGGGSFAQHHPRRAEVLHRDRNINGRLNRDRGNLDGHYGQLKREDRTIHRQERADKNANGGYITRQQKQQLNREENGLNRQIRHDQ